MNLLKIFSRTPLKFFFQSTAVKNPALSKTLFGLTFINPIGIAAGFDKNAVWLKELAMLGFGSVEIGTVTPNPQAGNNKPRLFRLPADKAILNRMGFNNIGTTAIAENLKKWRQTAKAEETRMIIGANIGKNKNTPNEEAWKDYLICFESLYPYVDYFVVNISSPNTPGLRELQKKESIKKILTALQQKNNQNAKRKPILLKIAPDLSQQEVDEIAEVAMDVNLDGIVISNTTISRDGLQSPKKIINNIDAGGLSGKPLSKRALELLRYFYKKTSGRIPIIASGGIFTGKEAKERLDAGASLIQIWTGFVYEGPAITKKICKALLK